MLKRNIKTKHIDIANVSKEELKIVRKHLPKKGVTTHLLRNISVPGAVKRIDAFLSFNDLGYVKNVPSFVKDVRKSLVKGGKFCFYMKYGVMNTMPNAILLGEKKKLAKIFKDAGLTFNYSTKHRGFRTEIYVVGKRK
jgi:hypothetical protein